MEAFGRGQYRKSEERPRFPLAEEDFPRVPRRGQLKLGLTVKGTGFHLYPLASVVVRDYGCEKRAFLITNDFQVPNGAFSKQRFKAFAW